MGHHFPSRSLLPLFGQARRGRGLRLRSDDVRFFFFFFPPWRLRSAALGLVPRRAAVYGGRLLGQRAAGSASLVRELPTRYSARLPRNSVAPSALACLLHSANNSSLTSSRSTAPARLAPHSRPRPRQPQRGGNVTASVPQVSLTSAGARAYPRLPQCRVPTPHFWERLGPGTAASADGSAETVAALRSHD